MSFVDRDTFMRFRGGGVGHIVTRSLDLRMEDGDKLNDEQEGEETLGDVYGDVDYEPEKGDSGTHEAQADRRDLVNEDDEEDADESTDEEQEMPGNVNNEQDNDDDLEDEESVVSEDGILDEEGFAEL